MSFLLITPVSPDKRRRQCLRLLKPGSERFNPPAELRVFLAGVSWFVRVGKLGGEDGRVLGWIVPSLVCVFDLESRQTKHEFQCMLTRKKATLTNAKETWGTERRSANIDPGALGRDRHSRTLAEQIVALLCTFLSI